MLKCAGAELLQNIKDLNFTPVSSLSPSTRFRGLASDSADGQHLVSRSVSYVARGQVPFLWEQVKSTVRWQ